MRVLLVTQYFWPENNRVNDLVLAMQAKSHSVTVLTGKPNYPKGRFYDGYGFLGRARENYQGVDVVRVPVIPRGRGGHWQLLLNYLSFVIFACLLSPFRLRNRFDIIFVYQLSPVTTAIPALFLKWMWRKPMIMYVLDLWPDSISAAGATQSPLILGLVGKMVQKIYHRCDRILVSSRGFVDRVVSMAVPPEKVVYWPQWAEELYRPASRDEEKEVAGEIPSGFRVMFAGNIGAAQSVDSVIEAAKKLREHEDIHWIILGDGRLRPWVEEQVCLHALQNSVHLLGSRPPESMPQYFAYADVLLVTLKKDPALALTLPGRVQSFLACGRPIIAATDGETARVVEEARAGYACPAEDPAALARAVLDMYQLSPDSRESFGRNGADYCAAYFNRAALLDKLDSLLNQTAADGGSKNHATA